MQNIGQYSAAFCISHLSLTFVDKCSPLYTKSTYYLHTMPEAVVRKWRWTSPSLDSSGYCTGLW